MDLVCEDERLVTCLRWFKTYFSVPQNTHAETNISEFLAYGPIEHSFDLQFPYVNIVKCETERQNIEGQTDGVISPGRWAVLTVELFKDTLIFLFALGVRFVGHFG